jgi:hypothetical protein
MCDYSLMGLPNRLAAEREELVVYRFSTGTIGLTSPSDLQTNGADGAPAVCIPPGTQLLLRDIPLRLRWKLQVKGEEEVTFTQITAARNAHRDAVRFGDGREILLQELNVGQRVLVRGIPKEDNPPPVVARTHREGIFAGAR